MIAVDVSNYSGYFTWEQAQGLRDVARKIIIGTQDVTMALHQLRMAENSCLERELYVQPYASVSHKRELDKAAAVAREGNLFDRPLWIAVEDEPLAQYPADLVDCWLWKHIEYGTQLGFTRIGIYTRAEFWARAMREYAGKYADMGFPLWLADYDLKPVLAASNPIPGWEHVMKQYDGWYPNHEVWAAGVRVDFNVY